ncbi:MAG: class I SAM-dependent methyltransferase [Actinomycetota bacterium]
MTSTGEPLDTRHDATLYGRSFVDVYDDWYADLHDLGEIVAAFGRRVPAPARLLELGSGTGRLAEPFVEAGYQVVALDSSLAMLTLDPSDSLRVGGDMASLPIAPNSCDAAVIAYNTFFNLTGESLQQACLRDTARALRPGGLLAIEAFVAPPPDPAEPFGLSVVSHHTHADRRMAIVTWQETGPAASDPSLITGAHIELGPDGSRTRPWQLSYRSPAQIDALAAAAGLELIERVADWSDSPSVADDTRHVSWYRGALA